MCEKHQCNVYFQKSLLPYQIYISHINTVMEFCHNFTKITVHKEISCLVYLKQARLSEHHCS